jgi:hypothetical protein
MKRGIEWRRHQQSSQIHQSPEHQAIKNSPQNNNDKASA